MAYLKFKEGITIKIAVLHHALGRFGGGEKIAILHSLYLKKMGFEVELFYNGPIPYDWNRRVQSSIPLNTLPFGLTSSFRGLRDIWKLIRRLDSFDVILINHHICPFLAYYLTMFMKSKLVWYCGEPLRALWEDQISGIDYRELSCTVKSSSMEFYGKSFTFLFLSNSFYTASVSFLKALDKLTVHSYPTIITNSKYTKKVVKRIYGVDKHIPVVYPGVENLQCEQEVMDKELEGYILAVGAMIPMKNHAALLKAFSSLPREHRLKVKLIVVGNGPLENEIRSLACKLDLKNVIFEPRVSEQRLSNYYANCIFTVHLALHEPFGLVPVEAALHGKPSIVSNNGGTSEFVIHGENGFIVDPKNQKDVANAMERLIEDRMLAIEMGLKAKERAIKEFTIEKSAENLVRTLETRM